MSTSDDNAPPAEPIKETPSAVTTAHPQLPTWFYLVCGVFVTFALLGAKLLLEQFSFEKRAEYETRAFLLDLLPTFREAGADAIVLDISQLKGGTIAPETGRLIPTSRADLQALLERLVDLSPAGIGIDVDFSGGGHGWQDTLKDPAFFDRCLELNRRVPIRLGVNRSIPARDGRWLVSPRYSELAAAIYLTDSDSGNMPISVGIQGEKHRLLTLSASLAAATKSGSWDPLNLRETGGLLKNWMFEQLVPRSSAVPPYDLVIETQEAPVNFSVVRQLSREYIPKVQVGDLVRYASRIAGRIVIIGDVENPKDFFPIPGDRVNRSGVFLHAAQSHSLTTEPVYVFSHSFRVSIDAATPLLILSIVLLMRRFMRDSDEEMRHRIERRLMWFAIGSIAVAGFALAYYYRIFWLDFLVVIAVLLVHQPAEHWCVEKLSKMRRQGDHT